MPDLDKMDRTWLCSVLFMDIVNYSSQSVELQMKWKQRFNSYLTDAIRDVPENERVILDTGDGAAVCFLGAPEVPMFAALQLARCFTLDVNEHQPGLRVRIGINLGPVKLVKDINGALNAIGDGINAGQRIMSFAADNQILVSQSFFEVVSRLSDDYKLLFQLKGVETDKHVREHTVYHLTPPGLDNREQTVQNPDGRVIAATPQKPPPEIPPSKTNLPWIIAAAAGIALAAVGVNHFYGSPAPAAQAAPQSAPSAAANTQPVPTPTSAATVPANPVTSSAETSAPKSSTVSQPTPANVPPPANPGGRRGRALSASASASSPGAKAAFDQGVQMIASENGAEAAHHFDEAIRLQPDFFDAYLGRAEARRILLQYDLSLQDCAKAIQLRPDEARGYNCRGMGHQMMKQYDAALADFDQAIKLDPNLVLAWEHRGTVHETLQQYDHAVEDYTHATTLAPRNPLFLVRLGTAYNSLKQYDKAIHALTEAIRLQPNLPNAYRLRAIAEQASGDTAGAAADRAHVQGGGGRRKQQ